MQVSATLRCLSLRLVLVGTARMKRKNKELLHSKMGPIRTLCYKLPAGPIVCSGL